MRISGADLEALAPRNGAVCAGFARKEAKGSGARIGATGFERKSCGSLSEIECGLVKGPLGQAGGHGRGRECE